MNKKAQYNVVNSYFKNLGQKRSARSGNLMTKLINGSRSFGEKFSNRTTLWVGLAGLGTILGLGFLNRKSKTPFYSQVGKRIKESKIGKKIKGKAA